MNKQAWNDRWKDYRQRAKKVLTQNAWLAKYIPLSLIVGILVGALCTLFGRVLILISDFRAAHYLFLLPFLPLAGLLIVWMYRQFSPLSQKGMTLVFEVGQKKRDSIPLPLIPLVILSTWITHLFGGSAGREGVAVQLGATLSNGVGRLFCRAISNTVDSSLFCHGSFNGRLLGIRRTVSGNDCCLYLCIYFSSVGLGEVYRFYQ